MSEEQPDELGDPMSQNDPVDLTKQNPPVPTADTPWREPLVAQIIRNIMAIGFVLGMFASLIAAAVASFRGVEFNGGPYILAFSTGAFLTLGYNVAVGSGLVNAFKKRGQ